MEERRLQIGIIGSAGKEEYKSGGASVALCKKAEKIGFLLARSGVTVVTGGKSGIMEAAARGAKKGGGITIGVIKGIKRFVSNNFVDVELITGMQADGLDELLLVLSSDALIALGGGAGTLQEIAIAYRNQKPLIALAGTKGWGQRLSEQYLDERRITKVLNAKTPKQAVSLALKLARKNPSHHNQPL